MAIFKPYKVEDNQLSSLPVTEGQFIVTTDTKKIYLDKDSSNRIEIAGTEVNDNLVNGSAIGSLRGIGTDTEDNNYTMGNYAFAEGYSTKASGDYSHAEGYYAIANGIASHAEGYRLHTGEDWYRGTFVSKETVDNKLVLKVNNWIYTVSESSYSACPGQVGSKLFYQESTETEPFGTITAIDDSNSNYSLLTLTIGDTYTGTTGDYLYLPGIYTDWRPIASNYGAHAEGCSEASGYYSHAEGEGNKATSFGAHAEGEMTTASSDHAHAEGYVTTASGSNSHAEGSLTTASGRSSHAEGSSTTASQQHAHAEGGYTVASNYGAHAEGSYTVASGQYSHAEGNYTKAGSNYQHAQGKYNIEDTASTYADIIGNGSSNGNRSNAATVDWSGNAWYAGDVYVGSTSGTNKDAGSKKLLKEGDVITGVSVNGTSIATSGVADITSVPASILTGAIPSAVTATTQTQGDNSTKIATTAYVDTAISNLPDPMVFKGSLGTGGTITALPVDGSANVGDTYKVITDGTYASKTAKVGDTFICLTKTSSANTWELIPSGDEPSGTVTSVTLNATSPIAIDSSAAITTSGSRTISHATSGVTAGTYTSVTVDTYGHVTIGSNPTTLSGYGITDASISSQTVTLGTNSVTVPTKTSDLVNDMNFMSGMTILSYGNSTWSDFITAYTAKHVVYTRASSGSNPASGSQTRLAFMAYVNNADSPTEVEFQYYRSVSSHNNNQQGDQTYVYKLNKTNGWSVTVRENYTKVVGSDGITGTWSSGTLTLKHDASGVTAGTYNSVTVDAKGHVTAGSNPTTLSGYGITDVKIENGTITLGSNTITPLTSYTEINSNLVNGSATGSLRTISSATDSDIYTIGQDAFGQGYSTCASGQYSHAEGSSTLASQTGAHAEGYLSTASGNYSHAEGWNSKSIGQASHAEGYGTTTNSNYSHAEGYGTKASSQYQHVEGKYNIEDSNNTYAHIVGGGTSSNNSKNIHTLTWTGEAWYQGDVYVGSTSGTNKDAGSKKLLKEGDVTDTKNTAGSTNTSNKIFLIGATSQADNPQTYSQDTAYVGTDGHLYSNSKQVVNLSDSQALTNKTYNGYTLAAASAKGVDISITETSTSTNLPTTAAVVTYVNNHTPTIDNASATVAGVLKVRLDDNTHTLYITNNGQDA